MTGVRDRGPRPLGSFGGVLPGPSSSPVESSGEEWLDQRTHTSVMDAAFAAEDRDADAAHEKPSAALGQ